MDIARVCIRNDLYFLNVVKTNKPDVNKPILLLSFIPMTSIQVEIKTVLKRQHLKLEIKMKFKQSYNNLGLTTSRLRIISSLQT